MSRVHFANLAPAPHAPPVLEHEGSFAEITDELLDKVLRPPRWMTPALLVTGLVYALLMGFVGGIFPAIRAARLPIPTALRAL